MTTSAFRFEFQPAIAISEVEMTLHLALYAVEGLFGEARVRLDTTYRADEEHRIITLDGSNEVGAAIVKVFTRLLIREFGEDGFVVRRAESGPTTLPIPAHALQVSEEISSAD